MRPQANHPWSRGWRDMPGCRGCVAAAMGMAAGLWLAASAARADGGWPIQTPQGDRYWAMRRDGSVWTGRELRGWEEAGDEPRLDDEPLLTGTNPVRVVADVTKRVAMTGGFVRFTNGDVLPCRIVGAGEADEGRGVPAHLVVSPASPLLTWRDRGGNVTVRLSDVAGVVFDAAKFAAQSLGAEATDSLGGGWVRFVDGTHRRVSAVRFTEQGVEGLTSEGSFSAAFEQVAEVRPPRGEVMQAVIDEATMPCVDEDGLVDRITASNGAVLTGRGGMVRIDARDRSRGGAVHYLSPSWSMDVIGVPLEEVVMRSFRRPEDVPVSLLPAERAEQRSVTGYVWGWRRDRNVHGGPLHSGLMGADLGLGVHAYSAVSFRLPPGAIGVTGWVGIDEAVGEGGCVRCAVYRDSATGEAIWRSGYLRGTDASAARFDVEGLAGAQRVVLVTEYGHDGRPSGADPFDIRDSVDWLWPEVRIDRQALARAMSPQRWIGQLSGWRWSEPAEAAPRLRPYFSERTGRWHYALALEGGEAMSRSDVLMRIDRRLTVTEGSALLRVEAGHDGRGSGGHVIEVRVDGQRIESAKGGDGHTGDQAEDFSGGRTWNLDPWMGRQIELSIVARPRRNGPGPAHGLLLGRLSLEAKLNESAR